MTNTQHRYTIRILTEGTSLTYADTVQVIAMSEEDAKREALLDCDPSARNSIQWIEQD